MHQKARSVLLFASLLFIQILSAQVTITIPSGNSYIGGMTNAEWHKPLGTYDGYERTAFILQHGEIGQYGQINSIAFYCDTSIHNPGNTPVKIYAKETDSTLFINSKTVAGEETGAQLVYSGTIPSSAFVVHQWVTINFSTAFTHSVPRSVEFIIETNATGTGNENALSKSFYHSVWPTKNTIYWGADNTPPAGLGVLSNNRPNVQLGITSLPVCSGSPTAGTTISSVDTTCSAVSLSLQGISSATGLTFQWQDSLAGGSWTNISGATNSTLNTSISADTWYRCKVNCSSQSSFSVSKQVVLKNYMQCYCFANLGGGCGSGTALDSVAIESTSLVISHTGCSANNYTLYPASGNTCAQLSSGQNYNLHSRFNGNVSASVWVDYNQNGEFDISEWKQICGYATTDSDYVTVLNVPSGAKTGLTLMRIRTRAAGNVNGSSDACTNFGSGETEDFYIGINYPVGIKEANRSSRQIDIHPNPVSNTLYISLNSTDNESIIINLLAIDGTAIGTPKTSVKGNEFTLDVSSLPVGIYFLTLQLQTQTVVKKVVISR